MPPLSEIIGNSPAVVALQASAGRLLERSAGVRRAPPILILGETGTGKGLLARALQHGGPRADKPFVRLLMGSTRSSRSEPAPMLGSRCAPRRVAATPRMRLWRPTAADRDRGPRSEIVLKTPISDPGECGDVLACELRGMKSRSSASAWGRGAAIGVLSLLVLVAAPCLLHGAHHGASADTHLMAAGLCAGVLIVPIATATLVGPVPAGWLELEVRSVFATALPKLLDPPPRFPGVLVG